MMMKRSNQNLVATIEQIEKTGRIRRSLDEDYVVECYGVFTEHVDYWFSGLVSICKELAFEQFAACKHADIPCEIVDAMADEVIDSYRM
jgi:hypothetical protein